MRLTLLSLASLFVSCFIMMLGNGLINILLPVRMGLEEMSTETIGLVLSLYFVGMLIGGVYSRHLIRRAGHIRMFAGCLALAAVSILVCSLYTGAILWGAMRIVIGFCNACAYTAMESWLSESSDKNNRGKVLAFYQVVVLVAMFCGQFLINVASPKDTVLFVLSGILLSAAIVPIVLSRTSGPAVVEVSPMSLLALFRISPLGVVSCFTSGVIYSAAFNMLPIFAGEYGIAGFKLSLYMGAAIMGAFVLQFPVGYLSDRFDRRTVLLVILVISALVGFSVNLLAELELFWPMSIATAVTCGIIACTYPMSISESFDKLRQSEMVAAMGSLILAFAIGGILGPYVTALIMDQLGNRSLFGFLGVVQLLLCVFVVYRMTARKALPVAQQEHFVMQGAAITAAIDLDPRTEYIAPEPPQSPEAVMAVKIAGADPAAAVKMARAVAMASPEQGAEIAAAVAQVEGIDVLRLYEVMLEAVPEQILPITSAIVSAKPDLAYDLVSQLAMKDPDNVVDIAAQIGRTIPALRMEMARVAVEVAPWFAVEVADYYAKVLAEEQESIRPADRQPEDGDNAQSQGQESSQEAVEFVERMSELAPEQALDIAGAMVEAMPEVADDMISALSEGHEPEERELMVKLEDRPEKG